MHTYSADGQSELTAYVFHPAPAEKVGPRAAIVLFHGGGWAFGHPQWVFTQAQHYAEHGMVAVAAEYRLSDHGEITPVEAMADARAAIRWTRENADTLGVDPGRIAAYGCSAGAHLAVAAAVFDDAAEGAVGCSPDALVLVSPAVSLQTDRWFRGLLGDKATVSEVNPVEHMREGLPPAIVLQGDVDTVTPLAGVREFCQLLRAKGTKCELHVYKGFGHVFTPEGTSDQGEPRTDPRAEADAHAKADRFLISLGYME